MALMSYTTNGDGDGDLDFMALRQCFLNFSVRDERDILFQCVIETFCALLEFLCIITVLSRFFIPSQQKKES